MLYIFFKKFTFWQQIWTFVLVLLYIGIFYLLNFTFNADLHFKDQKVTACLPLSENVVPDESVVLGIYRNQEARAYPIDYLAYHHKIYDSIGNDPILVTYCSICRSGRIFSPVINGKSERFSLVGTSGFNAIFEDKSTDSWWQQATGEAIAGKRKGEKMTEYFTEQMTLASWKEKFPNTLVLQPDTTFNEIYEDYLDFGSGFGEVNYKAEEPWEEPSWIIGIAHEDNSLAIDYDEMIAKRLMHDSLGDIPILVTLELDTLSIHAWDTRVDTANLYFEYDSLGEYLVDTLTQSVWDMTGTCIEGKFKGTKLFTMQSYVEYWHSWQRFHPDGERVEVDSTLLGLK